MITVSAMTDHQDQVVSKRQFARYPADRTPLLIESQGQQFAAVAVDESIGGLGIETEAPVAIEVGELVKISFRESESCGQITAVVPKPSGGCRISVSWDERKQLPVTAGRRPFFKFGAVTVVCKVPSPATGGTTEVTLWDGKSFSVDVNKLLYRTRQMRLVELQTMGRQREVIAQLYAIDPHGSADQISQRILDFEFS